MPSEWKTWQNSPGVALPDWVAKYGARDWNGVITFVDGNTRKVTHLPYDAWVPEIEPGVHVYSRDSPYAQ